MAQTGLLKFYYNKSNYLQSVGTVKETQQGLENHLGTSNRQPTVAIGGSS